MMQYSIQSIGTVVSPYQQKFGIPRQPQLVPAAKVCIQLHTEFTADCVRALDGFEYIWVQFLFHEAIQEGWAQLVRPPRLGGKRKVGVFASRSPHRPNHLGLSLLKLEQIETNHQVCLWCSGADLLDGTPVLDIKPYLPFIEAQPNAQAGFANEPLLPLNVIWLPENDKAALGDEVVSLITQSIAQDPRPAYQDLPERIYVMRVANYDVYFRIDGQQAWIIKTVAVNKAISF